MAKNELANQDQALDAATMETVIVSGDLSKLNPAQRVQWYRARCEAAGLDPRTQPFQYLQLQGKLTLYATKAATDQLIAAHKLNVVIVERRHDKDLGVYEVQCRVTFPDGRSVEDFAALPLKGLAGDQLCNAMMKAVTKAKRRTVLSACGLGMLDETEVETIPGARATPELPAHDAHHAKHHDNQTGHGSGAYADPEVVKQFTAWAESFSSDVNTKWLDMLTDEHGEIRKGPAELLRPYQLAGHLIKWGRVAMGLKAPDEIRAGSRDKYAAILWQRNPTGVIEEAREYARKEWRDARADMAKGERKSTRTPDPDADDLAAQDEVLDSLATTEAGVRG